MLLHLSSSHIVLSVALSDGQGGEESPADGVRDHHDGLHGLPSALPHPPHLRAPVLALAAPPSRHSRLHRLLGGIRHRPAQSDRGAPASKVGSMMEQDLDLLQQRNLIIFIDRSTGSIYC